MTISPRAKFNAVFFVIVLSVTAFLIYTMAVNFSWWNVAGLIAVCWLSSGAYFITFFFLVIRRNRIPETWDPADSDVEAT